MTQRYATQLDTASAWKQFQGQIVAGNFPLQEYLGGSDHSAVFLTYSNSPEPAKAAIKLVLDIPEKTKLLLSRWELAANLSHPHLLRLFHTGRCRLGDTNLLYAVMECADEDLSQILPQRALTAEEAEQMLPPVVDALAYIHLKGLVHGHIKPSNIMACGDHVKLSSDTICETGEPVIAPDAHDAPESTASVEGDIWSLGTAIVEVLTQRLPQSGSGDQMRLEIPQTVPAPFFDIAYGCLRVEPKDRWKLSEIASRLRPGTIAKREIAKQDIAKQKIPPVKEEARPSPPKLPPKRSYAAPTVGVGLLLIALVAGPIFLRHRLEVRPAPIPQSSEQSPETTTPERLAPIEPEAKLEKSTPKETTPTSAINNTISSAASATPPENASTPATDTPIESGVLHQTVPVVPDKARDTIRGTVRVSVKVAVDASGGVQRAELNASGPSEYFASLALAAAQEFKFEPGTGDGGAPREWILRFEFTNTGTKVFPARANP
jgi:TonB family protein